MTTTKQAFREYGAPMVSISAPTPVPTGSEAVIGVRHCGLCHSDIHLHDGYFDLGDGERLDVTSARPLPFTLGHEIEGEVIAVGPDVDPSSHPIGARRAVYPWIGCSTCSLCAEGKSHLCTGPHQLGVAVDGGFATHVLVPDDRYLLDYGNIDPQIAGSYMCSGLTAYSALAKLRSHTEPGSVLLVGMGGVGMMGLSFARTLFSGPIYGADIDETKRQAALDAGADQVFDPSEQGAAKAFYKETGGVNAAVDFAGTSGSFNFAQTVLRKGGKVVVAGLIGGKYSTALALLPMRSITIEGTMVGTLAQAREMLELVNRNAMSGIPVDTRPLDQINAAFDDLRAGRVVGRVVLTP